jgi:uncharacterized protein YrrD
MEQQMQFKANAEVITTNGDKVGEIDRVVIDPKTDTITHIVIREGFLFTSDKVVPVDWIKVTGEDTIVLNASKDKVDTLPDFEETHYVPREDSHYPEDYAPAYYWYPSATVDWWTDPGYRTFFGAEAPPFTKVTTRATPDGTVPLREGAKVYSSDDRHVGNVERIFADPDSERATHFVIEVGLIFKERKLIPTSWIDTMTEDEVFLGVSADFLDKLAPYKG